MSALAEQHAVKYATRDLPTLQKAAGLCRRRDVAVQAGGNLGVWPSWLADQFETVYSFEPSHESFVALVKKAPQPNVVKMQAALGETHARITLSTIRENGKAPHPGVAHVSGPGPIPTFLVDDLSLEACDLIALDLEGYEYFALRGASRTIERCKPVILVEINQHCQRYGVEAETIRGWLRERGYEFVCREHADEIWTVTA